MFISYYVFQGHTDCVNSLKFSPDGRWIISSGEDGSAKVNNNKKETQDSPLLVVSLIK